MKNVLNAVVMTAALAVAMPVVAKDVVKKDETTTTTTKETTKDSKDGTTTTKKTVHHHHHHHTSNYYGGSTAVAPHSYEGGTFLGYPIQGGGNPDDAKQSMRTVKQF